MNPQPPKPLKKCKCGIVYEGKKCPGCGSKEYFQNINKASLGGEE